MHAACQLDRHGWTRTGRLGYWIMEHATGAQLRLPSCGRDILIFSAPDTPTTSMNLSLPLTPSVAEVLDALQCRTDAAAQARLHHATQEVFRRLLSLPLQGTWSYDRRAARSARFSCFDIRFWAWSPRPCEAVMAQFLAMRPDMDRMLQDVEDVYEMARCAHDGSVSWTDYGILTWSMPETMHARLTLRHQLSLLHTT